MHFPKKILEEEAGYSLLEASVALALLVTVLMPLGTLAVGLFATNQIHKTISAHLIARDMMEETLALERFVPLDTLYHEESWRVVRSILTRGELTTVSVRVTPANRTYPSVELTTLRSK